MNRIRLLLFASFFAFPASAQEPRGSGKVNGVVFDSVAMAPLAGAMVQLALVDSTPRTAVRVFTATTDAQGRFAFDSLGRGNYGLGFQHPALSALGLEAPLRALRLDEGATATLNLAVPPGSQVRVLTCGGSPADSSAGLLAGYVTGAVTGTPLVAATVTAHWLELGVVDNKFRTVDRGVVSTVGDDGVFRMCGVLTEGPVQVSVAHAGFRTLSAELTLPPGGAVRQDIRLADSAAVRGTTSVSGRVTFDDGAPVPSGTILVTELGIEAPVANGAFTISGLPAGTWSIEARVIGYEPRSLLIDAVEGVPASVAVKLSSKIQMLDAVQVFGKVTGDLKVLNGIVERRRTAFGTTFLPGNDWLRSALYISDVLQAARGFRYLGSDSVTARGCTESTSILGGNRRLALYLDGGRFLGTLGELQDAVQIREVLAVEAYPDIQSIPALYRTMDACAAVLVWTKRG